MENDFTMILSLTKIQAFVLMFMYCFSMILEKIKWHIGGWSCDLFTILTAVYFVMLSLLHCIKRQPLIIDYIARRFTIYFLLLISYVLLQIAIISWDSIVFIQYIKGVVETFVKFIAVLDIIMLLNINKKNIDFEQISLIVFIITAINVLYCLLQNFNPRIDELLIKLFHSSVIRYGTDSYGAINRVTGLLLESNFNGPFMIIGLINEVYYFNNYLGKSSPQKRLFCLLLIMLTIIEILMTLSLTTYLGLSSLVLNILFKSTQKGYKFKLAVFIVALLLVIIYIFIANSAVHDAISSKFSIFDSIDTLKRSSHYRIAVESFAIYTSSIIIFVWGTGINCLNVYFQRIFNYQIMKAHSYYLQVLCELGFLGFFISLYYIFLLFRGIRCTLREKFIKLMLFCTLAMNFTYDPFTRNFNYIILIFTVMTYRESFFNEKNTNHCLQLPSIK